MEKQSHLYSSYTQKRHEYADDSLYASCSLPSPPYSGDDSNDSENKFINSSKSKSKSTPGPGILRDAINVDRPNEARLPTNLNQWEKVKFLKSIDPRMGNGNQKPSLQISIPNHLSKIYPSLVENIAHSNGCSPIKKPKYSNENCKAQCADKKKFKVRCNVCDNFVKSVDLTKHLFFGTMKCRNCNFLVNDCLEFTNIKAFSSEDNNFCLHENLIWTEDPISNLEKWLQCDSSIDSIKVIKNYILSLNILWKEAPWRTAVNNCQIFIKSSIIKEKRKEEAKSHTHQNRIESGLSPITLKRKKLHESEPVVDIINLPKDGNYLVVREAIEECPNCYTKINILNLSISLQTGLIDTICEECPLKIYFVLNPPDGSEHRIKILQS